MKYSQTTFEKYEVISRGTFWCALTLLICTGALSIVNAGWSNWLSSVIFLFVLILIIVSWATPGLLVVSGKPWFAQAWLRGINSLIIPATPWEELAIGKKIMIYFYSISSSAFVIFGVVAFIMNSRY
jgi:hypothetical protein